MGLADLFDVPIRLNSLFFQTKNSYFICDYPLVIDKIFARIRNYDGQVGFHFWTPPRGILNLWLQGSSSRPSYPKSIGRLDVSSIMDLTLGYDSSNPPHYKPSLPLSSGHMIQFRATSKDGFQIVLTIRTSGTEPKVRINGMSGATDDTDYLADQVLPGG